MSEIKDGGSAFPGIRTVLKQTATSGSSYLVKEEYEGMTLRDYFAAKAMQAFSTDYQRLVLIKKEAESQGHSMAIEISVQAYSLADAMLKARLS